MSREHRSARRCEHPILQRVRGNRLLDQIRHSDFTQQIRRVARLMGDMAALTLTMNFCAKSSNSILGSLRWWCASDIAHPSRPSKLSTVFAHIPTPCGRGLPGGALSCGYPITGKLHGLRRRAAMSARPFQTLCRAPAARTDHRDLAPGLTTIGHFPRAATGPRPSTQMGQSDY